MIDEVVALLLHNNDPVKPDAVSCELPQLLITDTEGAEGIVFGAVNTLPAVLTQPAIDCVTE